jgi:aminoglycoside 6'-N-acetyltransferase I
MEIKQTIRLRRLTAADTDLDEIARELNDSDSEVSVKKFTTGTLRDFLSIHGNFYLVAFIEGHIAGATHGYLHLHPAGPKYLYIDEVDTVKEFRRLGVASSMLREAFEIGRKLGASEAWVGTENDNEPAKALYLGFHPSEIENGPIYTYKLGEPTN